MVINNNNIQKSKKDKEEENVDIVDHIPFEDE